MRDVIVLGGGFAGLSAAVDLSARGARVHVIEARPALGGRASAFRDPATGETVDNGQHVLFGCYHETWRFLDRLGTTEAVHLQPELEVAMIDRSGRATRLTCAQAPPPWHVLGGLLEWDALTWRDRIEVLRLVPAIRRARQQARGDAIVAASPGETVENWLIRNGQGRRVRELLWEPLALAAMNQAPSRAAAPLFARVLANLCGPDRRDAAIGVPARPLDRLYAEPARALIEARGGSVRTGAPGRVRLDAGRLAGVEVRGSLLDAEAAVVAVPWFALASALPEPSLLPDGLRRVLEAARKTPSSPIVTVNLWLDRPILTLPFTGLPGRAMQWVFDKRMAFGGDASHLSLVSSGADALVGRSNEEVIAIARRELLDAIPAARDARLLRATAVRERQATFATPPGAPPRPPTDTGIEGLFLAGDWIDTGLPGTIESAVASGHRAAERVWQRLNGS